MEGLTWNLSDCRRSSTLERDQLGCAAVVGGRCRKKEALSRSHFLRTILTPNPKEIGSLTATIALVTVAGETFPLEWKR